MSPNGTRYPKTPENEKTIQTMHELKTMLSNKKPTSMIPDANSDANNDAKTDAPDTNAKIQDVPRPMPRFNETWNGTTRAKQI